MVMILMPSVLPTITRTFFIFTFLIRAVFPEDYEPDCGEIRENVEIGMVRLPDALNIRDNVTCYWQYSASPGRKLLVKVDNVKLLNPNRISSLQLYLNGKRYVLPNNCVRCLREKLNAETVRVHFISVIDSSHMPAELDPSTEMLQIGDVGTFQIRFKSFDPLHCETPSPPKNGFVIGDDATIGQKIRYACEPPYDLIGASYSQCIVPRDMPVPVWSPTPPACSMLNCTGSPVLRKAGKGAIAHPSFPSRIIRPNQHCHWIIEADINHRITISFIEVDIPSTRKSPNGFNLVVFDKDLTHPLVNITGPTSTQYLNFTSQSNVVIVKMDAPSKMDVEGGFYMEYSSQLVECPTPVPPVDGDIIAQTFNVGSSIAFRCNKGHALVGEIHAECLSNGQWSHAVPSCIPLPKTTAVTGEGTSLNETYILPENSGDESYMNRTRLHGNVKSNPSPVLEGLTEHPPSGKIEGSAAPKSVPSNAEVNEPIGKEKFPTKPVDVSGVDDQELRGEQPGASAAKESDHKNYDTSGEGAVHPTGTNADTGPDDSDDSEPTVELRISSSSGDDGGVGERASDTAQDSSHSTTDNEGFFSFEMILILCGVTIPLVVIILLAVSVMLYRKKYPVRMRFGRKFSTFENPMYVRKDAQNPRELSKLTETT